MKTLKTILFTLCVFLLAACSKEIDFDNSGVIGTWAEKLSSEPQAGVTTRRIYQFNENKTGEIYSEKYLGQDNWEKVRKEESNPYYTEFTIVNMQTEERKKFNLLKVWIDTGDKFEYSYTLEGDEMSIINVTGNPTIYKRIK